MKRFKNNKEEVDTWVGQQIEPGEYYTIETMEDLKWQTSDKVVTDITSGDLIINNGAADILAVAEAMNFLMNNSVQAVQVNAAPPFAAKTLPDGKKLYTRVHGVAASVSGAPDNIDFLVPYDNCKLTGIEILNGLTGDTVNLKILDTPTGTITGVPYYTLNQFGFNVNVGSEFYVRESAYDADLIKDLTIRIEYDSIATLPANVYVNFMLHEVKP